jgi:diguanylate cyclase (GGDEF)-like protein
MGDKRSRVDPPTARALRRSKGSTESVQIPPRHRASTLAPPEIEQQASSTEADRQGIAKDRARAAADRSKAASDLAKACEERAQSERALARARDERTRAARDRAASEIDDLTHVRRRGAGIKQLQREIDRARRRGEDLVVAFIDVDGLKQVNDTKGHLAGDALLIAVADSLRACLRSYDLVLRYGGDEFVCVLPHAEIREIRQRFVDASAALTAAPVNGSITVGFAELHTNDSAYDLIHRADADLLARRGSRGAARFLVADEPEGLGL